MKNLLVALVISGVFSAGQALAQGKITVVETLEGQVVNVQKIDKEPPPAFNSFQESDKNGNGCVESAEARLAGIMQFQQSDRDGNGCLNEQEYANAN